METSHETGETLDTLHDQRGRIWRESICKAIFSTYRMIVVNVQKGPRGRKPEASPTMSVRTLKRVLIIAFALPATCRSMNPMPSYGSIDLLEQGFRIGAIREKAFIFVLGQG
jgi:hypothetical protein